MLSRRMVDGDIINRSQEELAKEISDLKRYEKNFQAMVEGSLDAILVVDMQGAILYANPAAEQLFEMPQNIMIGAIFGFPIVLTEPVDMYILQRFEKFVAVEMWIVGIQWKAHPAYLVSLRDITRLNKAKEELIQSKEHLEQEVQDRTQDLARVIVELRTEANEHKRAENALRESESRFRTLADNIPNFAWMAEADGRIFWYNKQWYDYTGTTPEEMQRWGWQKVHHPDFVRKVTEEWKGRIREGQPYDNIFPLRGKDGNYRWFLTRITPVRDEHGKILRWLGTSTDITERIQAEEELREREADLTRARARLQAIFESLPVAIFIGDSNGKIVEVNRMGNVIWGGSSSMPWAESTADYILFKGWWADTGKPVMPEEWAMSRALKGMTVMGDIIDIQRFDGSRGTILNNAAPIKDREGHTIGAVVVAQDITERRRLEKELKEAKDRSDLYVDLMSHDINNMNMIGINYLELALDAIEKCPEEKIFLEKALGSLQNSSKLIDNVRKLQRVKTHEVRHYAVDVCELLSRVKSEYENVPDRKVTINLAKHCECTVNANELLYDVFSNLVSNAIKHSEGPLTIGIDLSRVLENGKRCCRISIEDNGPGISPEVKERLFNRFQRGATRAHGKGLGLYLVKTLITDYHGKIWVEDRVKSDHTKGARFVVMLPAIENH